MVRSLTKEKPMMTHDDPREGCELCKMIYGMEEPKLKDLCNSKNCIALIASEKKKPDFILLFPKIHEMNLERVKRRKELQAEMEALIRRTKRTLKEKHGAERFRVTWHGGGMLLRLTGDKKNPVRSVKAHTHCKIEVFYR